MIDRVSVKWKGFPGCLHTFALSYKKRDLATVGLVPKTRELGGESKSIGCPAAAALAATKLSTLCRAEVQISSRTPFSPKTFEGMHVLFTH